MANVTICEYELDQLHQANAQKDKAVEEMREGFQKLYAERGEDELISSVCNKFIEKFRNGA